MLCPIRYPTAQGAKASAVTLSGIDVIAIGHHNNINAKERSSTCLGSLAC
jgi:hypothetical protein